MRMYLNNNGANWSVNTGWSGSGDHCSWQGVTCSTDKKVTALSLGGNQLSGTFPSDLNNLESMESLNIENNGVSGLIPSDLCARSVSTALYINADSDNCPHGFDSSTGTYTGACCDELTIQVDVFLDEFASSVLGNSVCADLAGTEVDVCNYMTDQANHDIFASGYPTSFTGNVWSWLKVRILRY